jgi:DNA primase
VVILFDGDAAGQEAAKKSREPCREAGLDARVAILPQGQDPDEFVREKGPEALGHVIASAQGMLEFLIEQSLDQGFEARDMRDRAARVQEVAQLLASEDDPTVRAMARQFADTVASRLGIADANTFRAVWQAMQRASQVREAPAGSARKEVRPDRVRSETAPERVALEMLGCVIDCPEILDDPRVEERTGLLEGEVALTVGLARILREGNADNVERFVARVPSTIQDFAARRLSRPHHEDAGAALSEFLQNAEKIRRLGLSRDKQAVLEELDRAGSRGDSELEDRLLREAERKARERHGL